MSEVIFFDGDHAPPIIVGLVVSDTQGEMQISAETMETVRWKLSDVRRLRDVADPGQIILFSVADPLARLIVQDRSILRMFPALNRRAPPKGRKRLAKWAVAAVAAVAIQIMVLIPILADQLAVIIPAKGERALGEATLGQIRNIMSENEAGPLRICSEAEGSEALAAMEARLRPHIEAEVELTVMVLNHKMVNAFALPGGYVVLFRGLIQEADSAEEVAAVLAHEIGHVVSRDPTRHALRSAGSIGVLGLLFGDFAGGAVMLFLAEQLVNAQYAQEAEAEADRFATELLLHANLSPRALATFFERLQKKHGDAEGLVSHFMSHPALSDRIDAAAAAVPGDQQIEPILSEDQWHALRDICGSTS